MTTTKKTLIAALLSATAIVGGVAAMSAPAHAGSIKNGSPVDLTIGGHVNRAVLLVDDGNETSYRHVDNENDSTIIFFEAEGKVNAEITIGAAFAAKMRSNASNEVSATAESAGSGQFEHDQSDIYVSHARFGTLTMGEGSMASDAISEVDLSGTGVAGYSSIGDMAGGFAFVNSATGVRSTATIGGTADNLDGLDAGDRLMYETRPSMASRWRQAPRAAPSTRSSATPVISAAWPSRPPPVGTTTRRTPTTTMPSKTASRARSRRCSGTAST